MMGSTITIEGPMSSTHKRVARVAGASALVALIGLAACSKPQATDSGLERDLAAVGSGGLELAPNSARPQVVVSAVEAGPRAAPAPAVRKPTPRPTPRPAPRIAANNTVAPAPAPAPLPVATVTAAASPPKAAEPAPLPPAASRAQGRQAGTYSSEAEVFRKMPWIKP